MTLLREKTYRTLTSMFLRQSMLAGQRYTLRPNDADRMAQAKRLMAAQRERKLYNYQIEKAATFMGAAARRFFALLVQALIEAPTTTQEPHFVSLNRHMAHSTTTSLHSSISRWHSSSTS